MNTQQIQDLIDKKIKGQGSMIDVGGGLPPILTALNENVDKAVSPDSTDMTVEEQMQVRKNLGLYYEETTTEKLEYDPDGQQVSAAGYTGEYFVKASDFPIELADLGPQITSLAWNPDTSEFETVIVDITPEMIDEQDDYYRVLANPEDASALPLMIVVLVDSATIWSTTLTKGVWFGLRNGGWHPDWVEHSATYVRKIPSKYLPEIGTSDAVQYIPQELTEAQQMQARKNQDLYYSEQGQETTPLVTDQQAEGGYYKVSDDTPTKEEIIGIILMGMGSPTPLSQFTVTDFTEGFTVSSSVFGVGMVLYSDYVSGGATLHPGIYLLASTYDSFLPQFVYESGEVVHKIPSKYLPDMPSGGGIETVELLSVPTNFASSAAETTFFSADDWVKVKANNLCVAVLSGTPNRVFLVIQDKGQYVFYGANDIEFILVEYYTPGYVTVYPINGKQIILSELPAASMTSAELEALGFGQWGQNFSAWIFAKANTVVINDLISPQTFGVIALTSDYLEFWDATNKYVITNQLMQLACTVTPR